VTTAAWGTVGCDRPRLVTEPPNSADRTMMQEPAAGIHYIHPYPGTMAPRVASALLGQVDASERKGPPVLLDPFVGAGAVLVEGASRGCDPWGWDLNPLACLVSRVKLQRVTMSAVSKMVRQVRSEAQQVDGAAAASAPNADYWYLPATMESLSRLAVALRARPASPTADLLRVAFSRTALDLSLTNPRFQVPVRLRPDHYAPSNPIRRELERRVERISAADPAECFAETATRIALTVGGRPGAGPCRVECRSALGPIGHAEGESCDLIVTSPPYPGAQKYARFSALSLGWLDLAPGLTAAALENGLVGREHLPRKQTAHPPTSTGVVDADAVIARTFTLDPVRAHIGATYLHEMEVALAKFRALLRDGGALRLVVGPSTFKSEIFDTPAYLTELAENNGFRLKSRVDDPIRGRRLMTRRRGAASAILFEALLDFGLT